MPRRGEPAKTDHPWRESIARQVAARFTSYPAR